MLKKCLLIIALIFFLILYASQNTPKSTAFEAPLEDDTAEAMGDYYRYFDEIQLLFSTNEGLEREYENIFAGFWIDLSTYTATIGFTCDESIFHDIAKKHNVATVLCKNTFKELNDFIDIVNGLFDSEEYGNIVRGATLVDDDNSVIVYKKAAGDDKELKSIIDKFNINGINYTIEVEVSFYPYVDHQAGKEIGPSNINKCASGFTAKYKSKVGFVTSGHCYAEKTIVKNKSGTALGKVADGSLKFSLSMDAEFVDTSAYTVTKLNYFPYTGMSYYDKYFVNKNYLAVKSTSVRFVTNQTSTSQLRTCTITSTNATAGNRTGLLKLECNGTGAKGDSGGMVAFSIVVSPGITNVYATGII